MACAQDLKALIFFFELMGEKCVGCLIAANEMSDNLL
jgi:hypothetical protein